ncbi:MAG: lipid-A-disaccharide synthase [Leptolyngbyaceae cyanobacterium SL_1_1]|nr:lipid-A-disaccharide synthase [Leptolyngbyaceae cyanobacterium RM1_1_2]NJO11129.1 lipid-A-disaccharide synthase [Leptolyngbyaceae cyanobacterium SL_1_1]
MQPLDILILSNGPGEITTWVKPVLRSLRQRLPDHQQARISVVLSPCPHASGREAQIAQSYPEVDRVQGSEHFWRFLLRGRTADSWDWRDRGVVLFLGGDQFYPLVISRRLGYKSVIYAEWEARWLRWLDRFGVMNDSVIERSPRPYRRKLAVVGDLMSDVRRVKESEHLSQQLGLSADTELVGLLPGSKPNKLEQGVPLVLAIADYLRVTRPQARFVIPVAPTLDLETLAHYADPGFNRLMAVIQAPQPQLVQPSTGRLPYFKTQAGTQIFLWQPFPAYDVLTRCQICVTTIGANTAELGSLAVPMVVMLPTHQLDAMRSWDGLPGLLSALPGVGRPFIKLFNLVALGILQRSGKQFAWPNIWATQEIVPELWGRLSAQSVGDRVLDYLIHPAKLAAMSQALQQVRGQAGAADKLADLVCENLDLPISLPDYSSGS